MKLTEQSIVMKTSIAVVVIALAPCQFVAAAEPVSFDVLVNEIKGLALNVTLHRKDGTTVSDVVKE